MKKPISLRDHLTAWVPDLRQNPDKLHVFVEKGRIATKIGAGLAFEYRYTLQLLITDFAESPDVLNVPLLVWIQTNQPDLLLDTEKRDRAIAFEAEIIDHDKIDIALTLELTEGVLVRAVPGGFECEHIGEPPLPDDTAGVRGWQSYLNGELAATGNT